MQVSVESPNNIERRLTIVVPFQKVDEAFDKRILKIAKTAKIKGFRQGKVPLEHVKQAYGQTARQEALSEVIQSSLYTALNQEKLSPVGVPMVEPKAIMPGQPLEFIATIEILPTIQEVNFKLDKLEKETTTITDQEVETVIQKLREQHAKWNPVQRAAKELDQVLIDFKGSIDGKPFAGGEAKNYPIVLGSKTMIPGFEEGLLGAKPGEERIVDVNFPENYFAKEVAGKKAQFKMNLIKIFEAELPSLDEAFFKRLGVKSGNLNDLKLEISKNLNREIERLTRAKLKNQVFNKLIEQNPIQVPKALIENETKRIHDQLHPHHPGDDHHHSDQEMAGFRSAATQNVALGLLIAELIKKYNLAADVDRVNTYIHDIAATYEKPEEIVEWYQQNKKNRAEIEMQVLEEQVLEKLLEKVQVTVKEIKYQDFMKTSS